MVGAAHSVAAQVGQFGLDGVGAPEPTFVQQRRGGGTKAVGSGVVLAESHSSEREVHGVLADRSLCRCTGWKDQAQIAGMIALRTQDLRRQGRQRLLVWTPHFCALCGDNPNRIFEIEFTPFGLTQFAGTRIEQGHQLQGRTGLLCSRVDPN